MDELVEFYSYDCDKLYGEIGIKNKKVAEINLDLVVYGDRMKYSSNFSKVGSTTIDKDLMESLYEKAKEDH